MEVEGDLAGKLARLAINDYDGLAARAQAGKYDFYRLAVSEVLGIYIGDVMEVERSVAKTVFFGFSYGIRDFSRMNRLAP